MRYRISNIAMVGCLCLENFRFGLQSKRSENARQKVLLGNSPILVKSSEEVL